VGDRVIVWCPACGTNQLENPAPWEPWCAECVYGAPLPEYVAPEPRPDPLERGLEAIKKVWARIGMPFEYNTVDLKALREEREKRRGSRTTTSYSPNDVEKWLRSL
jgi:hypothetical protein